MIANRIFETNFGIQSGSLFMVVNVSHLILNDPFATP
jgi:hypothetical protein